MSFRRSSSIAQRDLSSLESGNASIIIRSQKGESCYTAETSSAVSASNSCLTEKYSLRTDVNSINTNDIIDLQSETGDFDESSEQALANVLAAAIQFSTVPVNQRSSLSSGRASVVLPARRSEQTICRRDSGSSVSSNDSTSPKTPTNNRRLSSFFGLNIIKPPSQQRNPRTSTLNGKDECNIVETNDNFGLQDLLDRESPKVTGAVRGGLLGFLLGVTISGGIGYYYLLEEYNEASASLLNSVKDLQASTDKVRDYARKIEAIDRDLAKLKESAATSQQLSDLRHEFKKLYDGLNIEHLELKTHVWGLEQDIAPKINSSITRASGEQN
ncbi:hypothetical protein NQZ79_g1424 [Umbelopsis isabellina]|nr:hypothetical protein NQZ79_g1424 [Umbelopsis isabellina]